MSLNQCQQLPAPYTCVCKLSCIDKRSRNAPGQHGGSLQTRFIESMRVHVITIYGKRTGKP